MDGKIFKCRVAVLGLGLTGVTAVKNLAEVGFDVVGYEQNSRIGGLWQWNSDPQQTSVLKSTRANITKQSSCYTDFPFPDDVPNYPTGDQIATYIEAYAAHFKLNDKFRLGVKVQNLKRSADGTQWTVVTTNKDSLSSVEHFDRVLVSNGAFAKAFSPTIQGQDGFKGKLLHAQAFKDPQEYKGKRVVVVGLSNTGADNAVALSDVAEKVYMSHRAGARIMSRAKEGQTPADHRMTRRLSSIGKSIAATFPNVSAKLGSFALEKQMLRAYPNIQSSWNLLPAPPLPNAAPVMNDFIISKFANGSITPVRGLKRFLASDDSTAESSDIELADGTILTSIDAVIFSTGYHADFSFCDPSANPTLFPTPEWDQFPHGNGLEYPRLYQGLLSTLHPDSLAFIGPFRGHSFAAFSNSDLSSQAIAQIWAGRYALPPKYEMEKWCDDNYRSSLQQLAKWRIAKVGQDPKKLERWLNEVVGNEVNENLGWGWKGWKFWWSDRRLYRLLVDGLDTPFLYRLFDGRDGSRLKWEGAREAIFKANGK